MARVICSLTNASELINGVRFVRVPNGVMMSEPISDEAAAVFASIPGYEIVPPKEPAKATAEPEDEPKRKGRPPGKSPLIAEPEPEPPLAAS